jgi:hypothetical protein
MQQYIVKRFEDPVFWNELNSHPKKGQDYPAVLTLGGYASFAFAPASVMQCYNAYDDADKALTFTVPATPQPITHVVFLAAPQVGQVRRIFVAFFWGEGQAILAECSFIPLLHRPMGLRIANGTNVAVNRTFEVSMTILKGDDAPIHMVLVSPNNPQLGVTLSERVNGEQSVLHVEMRAPNMAAMTVNQSAPF